MFTHKLGLSVYIYSNVKDYVHPVVLSLLEIKKALI